MHYGPTYVCVYTGHSCDKPGCGTVLVMDGNAKNRRDVCKAREAGYTEYVGLQGKVRTGCMNTPAPGSRFCHLHSDKTAIPQKLNPDDTSTTVNAPSSEECVVGVITAKRTTRNAIFYQVHTCLGYSSKLYEFKSLA